MPHIVIISASVRTDRSSHRIAQFFLKFIKGTDQATAEIADLNDYRFPVFNERLKFQHDPLPEAIDFADKIRSADGIIIVTPEYNGGYPAALKNAIDLLTNEWYKKPVAISTVSDGQFGGSQVLTSLQFTLWKIRAWTVSAMFPVPKVNESFDESGNPVDPDQTIKRATVFINELLWCIKAKKLMNDFEKI